MQLLPKISRILQVFPTAVCISLAFHFLLGLLLFYVPNQFKTPPAPKRLQVKIVAQEPPQKNPGLTKKIVETTIKKPSFAISHEPKSAQTPEKGKLKRNISQEMIDNDHALKNEDTMTYGQLMPKGLGGLLISEGGPDGSERSDGEASRQPYRGEVLGTIVARSQNLAVYFDLPLVQRREQFKGNAYAKFRLYDDQRVEIGFLGGEPVTRAALFEMLRTPQAKASLRDLFAAFRSKKFTLLIDYQTIVNPDAESEFKTSYKVYDLEIVITITRHLGVRSFGIRGPGVIPDKYSKQAVRIDREHLERLRQSAAYRHPVQNYVMQ